MTWLSDVLAIAVGFILADLGMGSFRFFLARRKYKSALSKQEDFMSRWVEQFGDVADGEETDS